MYVRTVNGKRWQPLFYSEFVCDSASDISSLPNATTSDDHGICAIGSKALAVDTGTTYILSADNSWVKLSTSSSSSGSGDTSDTDYSIATDEEVEEMLNEVLTS